MNFFKRNKKGFSILLIIGMFMQIMAPTGGIFASAEENEGIGEDSQMSLSEEIKDLGNIFNLESFKINGEEAKENQIVEIKDGTTVALEYSWDTNDIVVNPGDFAQIEIPDAFKIENDFYDLDIEVGDIVVGKYSIVGNVLKFVFDEGILSVGDVSNGYVGFGAEFNEVKFQEDVVEKIEFKDKKEAAITVIGKPKKEIKSISKEGTPDSSTDAKYITWEIDITNASENQITDAILEDILPAGLELDLDSIEVYNLNVKLDGTLVSGGPVDIVPDITGQNISFNFNSIAPYKGYRVSYKTIITDLGKTEFTNDALLKVSDKELPAKDTVSGLTRSDFIEKDGKQTVGNADQIEWTIDVNKNGGTIGEAIIEDSLPEGNTLVEDSIVIVKLTKSGDNWIETSSDKTATTFPVNLGKLLSTDIYRIKFKTNVDYSEINDGNYNKESEIKNEAILKDGDLEIGESEKIVTTTRKPILAKEGNANVNYEDKQINWKVTVNEANHSIKDAVITDTLPEGVTINENDIVVKDSKGVVVENGITVAISDGSPTVVTVNFGDINEKYTVEYKTTITDFTIDSFENGVSLGGQGVGTGGSEIVVPVKPPKNSYGKTWASIDYNEKTMNWALTVNPTREAITELTITDTFPNKGLILLDNTLLVKVGGVTQTINTHYTLTPIDDNYKNGFIIKFLSNGLPINSMVNITYTTSFDPEKGIDENTNEDQTYINKANFKGITKNGNEVNVDMYAEHKVKIESWNSGKKLGKLVSVKEDNIVDGWISGNERKIQWEVYINYLNQDLGTGVSVSDILGYDGEIDLDSLVVRKYDVAADGTTTLGETLIDTSYDIDYSDSNKKEFTIRFNIEVKERYAIVFTTNVPNISEERYTNTGTVKIGDLEQKYEGSVDFEEAGKDLSKASLNTGDKVYTDDEIIWKIQINKSLSKIEKDVEIVDTISKGLVYKEGTLKVYKLNGVERTEFNNYKHTLATNEDGQTVLTIKFDDEINSTYEIEYTTVVTAIDGEVNNTVSYSGNNLDTKTVTTTELKAQQFSYVGGDPSLGKIIIRKIDEEGEIITAEAEFEVYYLLNGDEYLVNGQTYTTVNGIIEIGNLRLNRKYFIREKTAPNGFVKDYQVMEIEVTKSSGVQDVGAYKKDFVNEHVKTTATGTKDWVNGPEHNRPTIKLQLYQNDIPYGDFVEFVSPQTEHTWEDLDLTDNAGVDYVYTVKEVGIPENYKKTEEGLTVTNEYVIPKISVTGIKEWVNGPEVKPTIKLQLYRDGEVFEDAKEIVDGESEATWDNLDKTDINGKPYVYTVKEVNAPDHYDVSYDGLKVINEYVSPLTSVTGTKQWVDGPTDDRPDVQLQLYRNGEALGEPVTLVNGETEYTWDKLDLTDKKANPYKYTVDEVSVPDNYGKITLDDFTVVNTYNSPTTDITGRKVWNGGPEEKPTVELQLYRDNEEYGEPVTLENGTFQYIWRNLDITDKQGVEYKYTVKEVKVPENYDVSENGLTVTNTYVSPKTEFTVNKVWVDGPKDRPTIELQLFRNGEAFGEPVVLADKQLEHTWTDLDLTDNYAVEYEYTVMEVNVPENYKSTISEDGLTITNTYVIPTQDVTGTKVWVGGPNIRPTIELQLYRDGVKVCDPVTLTNGQLTYTWQELDLTDINGHVYEYTVKEVEVPKGYVSTTSEDGLTITNTHKPTVPSTGINNNSTLFSVLIGFSSLVFFTLIKKKRSKLRNH